LHLLPPFFEENKPFWLQCQYLPPDVTLWLFVTSIFRRQGEAQLG